MLPPIFQALRSSSEVVGLVGTRIYRHGIAPQRPDNLALDLPYITWQVVSDVPENNLSDLPPTDRCSVQIDCWASGDTQVVELATAVRDVMERYVHMTGAPIDGYEPETRLYRMSLQFDWWLRRDGGAFVPIPDESGLMSDEGMLLFNGNQLVIEP